MESINEKISSLRGIEADYEHSIAAAWELVEEMRDKGACVEMGNGWGDPDWRVRIMIEGSYRYAYGDTAPLAICRAWLMWKQT